MFSYMLVCLLSIPPTIYVCYMTEEYRVLK